MVDILGRVIARTGRFGYNILKRDFSPLVYNDMTMEAEHEYSVFCGIVPNCK